jgi:hypothetical protein
MWNLKRKVPAIFYGGAQDCRLLCDMLFELWIQQYNGWSWCISQPVNFFLRQGVIEHFGSIVD